MTGLQLLAIVLSISALNINLANIANELRKMNEQDKHISGKEQEE